MQSSIHLVTSACTMIHGSRSLPYLMRIKVIFYTRWKLALHLQHLDRHHHTSQKNTRSPHRYEGHPFDRRTIILALMAPQSIELTRLILTTKERKVMVHLQELLPQKWKEKLDSYRLIGEIRTQSHHYALKKEWSTGLSEISRRKKKSELQNEKMAWDRKINITYNK